MTVGMVLSLNTTLFNLINVVFCYVVLFGHLDSEPATVTVYVSYT